MDKEKPTEPGKSDTGSDSSEEPVEVDWRAIFDFLHTEAGFSSREVGAMTRREVEWRMEMAAEKLNRRGLAGATAATVDTNTEFTEEETKLLDKELLEAQERVKERFKQST